jgi:hypothetical protein
MDMWDKKIHFAMTFSIQIKIPEMGVSVFGGSYNLRPVLRRRSR